MDKANMKYLDIKAGESHTYIFIDKINYVANTPDKGIVLIGMEGGNTIKLDLGGDDPSSTIINKIENLYN